MVRVSGEGSIYQRTDGLWAASIELPAREFDAKGNPKRRRKTITRKDKAELLAAKRQLEKQLHDQGDLHTASMRVADWNAYWLREIAIKTRRPSTIRSYRSNLKRVDAIIGTVRLEKVTPIHIRKVLSVMDDGATSSTYLRNTHSVMAASFKDAEREGRVGRSPVDLVQAPLKATTDLSTLTPDQVKKLIEGLDRSPNGYMWATYLLTGTRRGETLGLEWDRVGEGLDMSWQLIRIGWEHGCRGKDRKLQCGMKTAGWCPSKVRVEIPADYESRQIKGGLYWTRPKSRAGYREIPLVEPLRSILAKWATIAPVNEWGLVFTRVDEDGNVIPLDPDWLSREWKLFREANDLGNVRLHDLRHTTVDMLYAAGVSEPDIMSIVGHSMIATTRGYKSAATRERLAGSMRMLSTSLGYASNAPEAP